MSDEQTIYGESFFGEDDADSEYSHIRRLEAQNQALQERAERAEARLQLAEDALAMYQAGAVTHISIESRPTQETDPE